MTGFWFLIYVSTSFGGIYYGALSPNPEMEDVPTRTVSAILSGVILSLILSLSYNAGIYKYLTGYEGSPGWFMIWLILTIGAQLIFVWTTGLLTLILVAWSLFLIFMIDGFTQLSYILQ